MMTPFRRAPRASRRKRGIALLEAMIGILIFAFGVLGLMGLQAAMTKAQTSSKLRADAANLASDLLGLIQTDNPANMASYATASCGGHTRCKDWLAKVKASLPSGDAAITVDTGTGRVDVAISWQQSAETRGKYQTTMVWQQ